MSVKITAADNGPLIVNGEIELTDGSGATITTKQATYFCRCGLSANKPFCNGAHKGNFESEIRA
jgi:CDGSH-type Zn-finger protein